MAGAIAAVIAVGGGAAAVATGRFPGIDSPHHAPAIAAITMAAASDTYDA
jgi:hypothetical protein